MSLLTDEEQMALLETGGTTMRKMSACIGLALDARGLTPKQIAALYKRAEKLDKAVTAEMRAKAAFASTYKANIGE